MGWRTAKSIDKLRDQINAAYPKRSKVSDGTIGDPSHQAEGTGSDHNPNKAGVVCAIDITHDPANGVDIVQLADALANSRDARIKYLIRNKQIMVPSDYGWRWVPYDGVNPHTSHVHVSVWGDYDNTSEWKIGKDANEVIPTRDLLRSLIYNYTGEIPNEQEYERYVGKITYNDLIPLLDSGKPHQRKEALLQTGRVATDNKWEARIKQLETELKERPANGFKKLDKEVYIKD